MILETNTMAKFDTTVSDLMAQAVTLSTPLDTEGLEDKEQEQLDYRAFIQERQKEKRELNQLKFEALRDQYVVAIQRDDDDDDDKVYIEARLELPILIGQSMAWMGLKCCTLHFAYPKKTFDQFYANYTYEWADELRINVTSLIHSDIKLIQSVSDIKVY